MIEKAVAGTVCGDPCVAEREELEIVTRRGGGQGSRGGGAHTDNEAVHAKVEEQRRAVALLTAEAEVQRTVSTREAERVLTLERESAESELAQAARRARAGTVGVKRGSARRSLRHCRGSTTLCSVADVSAPRLVDRELLLVSLHVEYEVKEREQRLRLNAEQRSCLDVLGATVSAHVRGGERARPRSATGCRAWRRSRLRRRAPKHAPSHVRACACAQLQEELVRTREVLADLGGYGVVVMDSRTVGLLLLTQPHSITLCIRTKRSQKYLFVHIFSLMMHRPFDVRGGGSRLRDGCPFRTVFCVPGAATAAVL